MFDSDFSVTSFSSPPDQALLEASTATPGVLALASDTAFGSEKVCGFASSLSDVVVMNIWESDVGRDVPTNAAVLRSCLSSAATGSKPMKLVFVVHGCDSAGADYAGALMDEVGLRWEEVGEAPPLEECVAVKSFALPARDDPAHASAVGKVKKAVVGMVGAAGKSFSAGSVAGLAAKWDGVDGPGALPPAEELAAHYAADKAFEDAYAKVSGAIGGWRKTVDRGGVVGDFGPAAAALLEGCLADFDAASLEGANGVPSAQRAARRGQLKGYMKTEVTKLYASQVKSLTTGELKKFDAKLLKLLDGAKDSEALPADKAEKATRAAAATFGAAMAKLVVPGVVGSAGGTKESEAFGELLGQKASDFEETPAAKVLRMNKLTRKTQRSKKLPKNPRAIVPGLHLVAFMRAVGSGNLNGFAGYTLGPHSVTAGFDNTRGPPESGDDSAPIRLQPKVHFDIGECV